MVNNSKTKKTTPKSIRLTQHGSMYVYSKPNNSKPRSGSTKITATGLPTRLALDTFMNHLKAVENPYHLAINHLLKRANKDNVVKIVIEQEFKSHISDNDKKHMVVIAEDQSVELIFRKKDEKDRTLSIIGSEKSTKEFLRGKLAQLTQQLQKLLQPGDVDPSKIGDFIEELKYTLMASGKDNLEHSFECSWEECNPTDVDHVKRLAWDSYGVILHFK